MSTRKKVWFWVTIGAISGVGAGVLITLFAVNYDEITLYWDLPQVPRAVIVGFLTAICASLIGVPLVLKRYSCIGEGLSHVSFLGISLAMVINLTNNILIVMPLTVLTSVVLLGFGTKTKIKGDAAIAMLSVAALSGGYFVLKVFSDRATSAADVCGSLFGSISILTLQESEVWISLFVTIVVVAIFLLFYNRIFAVTFDANFMQATGSRPRVYEILMSVIVGVIVALSMRFVGALLTSALIIFPSISAMRVFKTFRSSIICSSIIAGACAIVGIFASMIYDTPVGSTIVIANIFVFAVFWGVGVLTRRVFK
jgi:zinc transport system permease protein